MENYIDLWGIKIKNKKIHFIEENNKLFLNTFPFDNCLRSIKNKPQLLLKSEPNYRLFCL